MQAYYFIDDKAIDKKNSMQAYYLKNFIVALQTQRWYFWLS